MDLDELATALNSGRVVVDPELPNAQKIEVGVTGSLTTGDDLVVVIVGEDTGDPGLVMEAVRSVVGDDVTVALSVGDEVSASGPTLGDGVAAQIMSKADAISNTGPDAVTAFMRVVHRDHSTIVEESGTTLTSTSDQMVYLDADMLPGLDLSSCDALTLSPGQSTVCGEKTSLTSSTDGAVTVASVGTAPTGSAEGIPVGGILGGTLGGLVLIASVVVVSLRRRQGQKMAAIEFVDGKEYGPAEISRGVASWSSPNGSTAQIDRHLAQCRSDVSDIVGQWDAVSRNALVAHEVSKIVLDYVPGMIALYDKLPQDIRVTRRARTGKSPQETLIEQLRIVDERLDEIRVAAFDGTMDDLEVSGSLLRNKYRVSALDMG